MPRRPQKITRKKRKKLESFFLTTHGSRPPAHNWNPFSSQFPAHGPCLTSPCSQLPPHDPRSQSPAHDSRLTTPSLRPPAQDPRLTTPGSRPSANDPRMFVMILLSSQSGAYRLFEHTIHIGSLNRVIFFAKIYAAQKISQKFTAIFAIVKISEFFSANFSVYFCLDI